MIELNSLDDSRARPFFYDKHKKLSQNNHALIESEKIVLKAFQGKAQIVSCLCSKEFYKKYSTQLKCKTYVLADKILKDLPGYNRHHGIFCLIKKPLYHSLEAISGNALFLNGVTSPENVGAIVRSAAAFGVQNLIFDDKSCDPYYKRCIRVSMGNIFSFKVYQSLNFSKESEKFLKTHHIISSLNSNEATKVKDFVPKKPFLLIMGSEGHGIEKKLIDLSNVKLRIPIDSNVAHLNVAHATSILLYELTKFNQTF